ncbi:hypothetical protein T01_14985 [Trichinella spiralis]|uniref:Uncharacterized protein n=1 Tax=Trichinella spiralis TaxID=6334 RepID=A0A0V1BKY1_TRISP|nr:hypothetical protein T01_14985 [Trichinella spiralis]
MADLKKQRAEETKPISAIYDKEVYAAYAEPSTSVGYFPVLKRVKSTMYSHRSKCYLKLPEHRRNLEIPDAFRTTKADCWQPGESGVWVVHSIFYLNGINNFLPSMHKMKLLPAG